MSLNEEKDEEHMNKLAVPRNIQDELIYVIQNSLYNIATQVNILNKYAEDLLGGLSNEVDKVSCRLKALQEHVIQLTDVVIYNEANKELTSPGTTSEKASQSTMIQTKQIYSCEPVKTYETHDASVQTLPLNMASPYLPDDADDLMISSDASYCFETSKEKLIIQSKEEKQEKLKHKRKSTDHPNETEKAPQIQLMENYVSENHIQDTCADASHSCVNQPDESALPSTFPFSEISKVLTRAVGKVLSSPLNMPRNGAGDLKNSLTYVNYGTGMGEVEKPQPRIRLKTKVFVSPTAPTPPPPLPPDWLALLRASKMATSPPNVQSLTQFSSPILRPSEATPFSDYLETTPEVGLPPKVEVCQPKPKPFELYDMIPHEVLPKDEEKTPSPPISPFPVISRRIETKHSVADLIDYGSVMQSKTSLGFPSARSSFTKSPRLSAEKSPRYSTLSTPRSSLPPPARHLIAPLSKPSTAPLPKYSTPQTSRNPASLARSSPRPLRSSIPPPEYSFFQSPRSSIASTSRHLDARSTRSSVASSGRSSVARSTGHLTPSQQRSSSLKSTKSFNLQSLFSFAQQPSSCISSPRALAVSQSPSTPAIPGIKLSPSTTPIFSKVRNVLMEAIRKGVLLRKTEEHCVLQAKIDISKSEETSILIHRKAVGYNSDVLEKKPDWVEKNKQNK